MMGPAPPPLDRGAVGATAGVASLGGPDGRFLDQLARAAELVGARRFREAEVEVLRALSIVSTDLAAMKLLALVRYKLGHLEEARAVCREIAATLPRDAGVRLKLGLIALRLNRADEAVLELELATRLAPDDQRAWAYLGHAHARRGERSRAAAAFRRAGREEKAREAESGALEIGELSGPAARPARAPGGERAGTPLHEFIAARRVPPADQPARLGAALRLPVTAEVEVYVRREAAVACVGAVAWTDARRHVRGRATATPLGPAGGAFLQVRGTGEVLVGEAACPLLPLTLNEDTLYVREEHVLAFEGRLAWEAGAVPRAGMRMLQFRGKGLVVLAAAEQPVAVAVTPERPAFVSAAALLGWVGKVVAVGRAADSSRPPAGFAVACEGEGVVLMDVAPRSDKERP